MKRSGLASLVAIALAYSAAGIGCEDDVPPPRRDAATTGGRDGSVDTAGGGTGGTGGMGGSGGSSPDATPDRAPDTMPDTPIDTPVTPDAPPDTQPPDTQPPDTLPPDTQPPDTLPPDTQPPDTQPPDTLPPDTQPPDTGNGVTVVTECSQVNCPALTNVTNMCNGDNQTCLSQTILMDPLTKRICVNNGVRKVSTATDNGVQLVVTRPGNLPCYTLDIDSPAGGPEVWIFKTSDNPGVTLGTVTITGGNAILTCAANNTRWDITVAGCAGMEGEGDCTDGACAAN
jgi:hypothetical protein